MTVHEIPDDAWTPKLVELYLTEAVRWAQSATASPYPRGDGETWPVRMDEENQKRKYYTPAKISQMERVLAWPMRYLGDFEKNEPYTYSVFKAWQHTKVNPKAKFDATCKQMNWSRTSAYRCRDRVLSVIAQGLTRDGIKRGAH